MGSLFIQAVYQTEANEIHAEENRLLSECEESLKLVKYVRRKGNVRAANYLVRHAAKCFREAFEVRGEREI